MKASQAQADLLHETWRWVHYDVEAGLPANRVHDLVETTRGVLWAHTVNGLAWYDGYRWRAVGPETGLPVESVNAVMPDLDGGLLVHSKGKLYRGDASGFSPLVVEREGQSLTVRSAVPFGKDDYVLDLGDGLYRYRAGRLVAFPGMEGVPVMPDRLLRTRSGRIWMHRGDALYVWTGDRWSAHLEGMSSQDIREEAWGGSLAVHGTQSRRGVWTWTPGEPPLLLEGDGRRIITTLDLAPSGEGVVVYSNGQGRVRTEAGWSPMRFLPDPLERALLVRYQRDGNLWVATQQGLYLYRNAAPRWDYWDPGAEGDARAINEVLQTRNGDLWVVTGQGVFMRRRDGTTASFLSIAGTALVSVTALAEDRDGGVWIGSGSSFQGAYRWYQGAWTHYGVDDGLTVDGIHKIVPDRQGRLWFLGLATSIGGPEQGPFLLDDGHFTPWGSTQGLIHGRVYSFAEGLDGERWFGTWGGLSRWKDGQWTHWNHEQDLLRNRIFTLAVGRDGRLWFGDEANGLGFIDAADRPRYLTVADGLVDARVRSLKVGPDGSLWIGTRSGLVRYREGIFATFGSTAGLRHQRVWPVLPMEDRVYVGTAGAGVHILYLQEAAHPSPVVVLAPPAIDAGTVQVRWQAFAYQGELPSDQVETRYRLNEGPWSAWGTTRVFDDEDVGVGTHTFTVQAKGLFGQIDREGSAFTFRIAPPFYRHPLFLLVVLLWAVSMGLAGHAYLRRQQRTRALLRQREEYFRSLIENAMDLVTVMDSNGIIRYQSPSVKRLLGYEPEALLGRSFFDFVLEEGHTIIQGVKQRAFQHPGRGETFQVGLLHADGSARIFDIVGKGISEPDGALALVINSRDVTERERMVGELETKNTELERFTYTVSHDLKAPLVTIKGFLGLLKQDVLDGDAERMESDLTQISNAADKMVHLLGDLLELSRIGRLINPPEAVALSELAGEAANLVAGRIMERAALVEIDQAMPVVHGDRVRLLEVYQNLIENAVKFMGDQAAPRIEIGAQQRNGEVVCYVKDNGIGIDPKYHENVFGLFNRLDPHAEGTGIGLALVRRIVEVHGGTIWVESEGAGQGTTFYFTLPKGNVSTVLEA